MPSPIPDITSFEDVARGAADPRSLAYQLKSAVLADEVSTVVDACESLSMAAAYHRRAMFEREQFAALPDYQVVTHFAFPMEWTRDELHRLVAVMTPALRAAPSIRDRVVRAIRLFDAAARDLGWGHDGLGAQLLGTREVAPDWYPGSRYEEAPMRADGVETFADEVALVRRLAAEIQETVARVAQVSGCPRAHGNHAKATVLSAVLEADPAARPAWRKLLGDSPCAGGLRLSNSSPDLRTPDHKGNLIGFRFSFMLDRSREPFTTPNADGGWMTLTANSAPRAHVATPERHVRFTSSIGSLHASPIAMVRCALRGPRKARDAARLVHEVVTAIPQGRQVAAFPRLDELDFHSRHAYRLGAQAVRYVVRVVEPDFPPAPDGWGSDPDYRHRVLLDVVASQEVRATIGIQVLPDLPAADHDAWSQQMIEDMTADWTQVPVEPFAVVRIPRQRVTPVAGRDRMIRWFADNPVDLRAAGGWFSPLGAAGRSRTTVYAASRLARQSSPPLGVPPRLEAMAP